MARKKQVSKELEHTIQCGETGCAFVVSDKNPVQVIEGYKNHLIDQHKPKIKSIPLFKCFANYKREFDDIENKNKDRQKLIDNLVEKLVN